MRIVALWLFFLVCAVLNVLNSLNAIAGEEELLGYAIEGKHWQAEDNSQYTSWHLYRFTGEVVTDYDGVFVTVQICRETIRAFGSANKENQSVVDRRFLPLALNHVFHSALDDDTLRSAKIYNDMTFPEMMDSCRVIETTKLIDETIRQNGLVDGLSLMDQVAGLLGISIGPIEKAQYGRALAMGKPIEVTLPEFGSHDFLFFSRLEAEAVFMQLYTSDSIEVVESMFPSESDSFRMGTTIFSDSIQAFSPVTHAQFASWLSRAVDNVDIENEFEPTPEDVIEVSGSAYPWWQQQAFKRQLEDGTPYLEPALYHLSHECDALCDLEQGLVDNEIIVWLAAREVVSSPVVVPHQGLKQLYCEDRSLRLPTAEEVRVAERKSDLVAHQNLGANQFFCVID